MLRRCPACRKLVLKCFYVGHLAKHASPVPDGKEVVDILPVTPAHPEWEQDDRIMPRLLHTRWTRRIGHECGHATASLAFGHCPEAIWLGNIRDEQGNVHQGLVKGGSLPTGASAENQAIVRLAGMLGESILFGQHGEGGGLDLPQVESYVKDIQAHECERRSPAEIEKDLIESAEGLLKENKDLLDALYEKSLRRAEEYGLARLHREPMQVLTGEEIQQVFDAIGKRRAKNRPRRR